MATFTEHFRMSEADVVEYIRHKLPAFFGDVPLTCQEIGDGNINYVFRVKNEASGRSLIVKHADVSARLTGQGVSLERNRIEANILRLQRKLAPDMVPEIYLYDPVMCCMVMQDVGDHENMRYALMAHETFPTFAEDISTFMAKTLIQTNDSVISPGEKKELVKEYTNPDLCAVSETLVFTFPFFADGQGNSVFPANADFVKRELFDDQALHLEAAKLKETFKSCAQSLIHGDLHSGSLFVKPGSTMVLDPEFAFYGPAGYDVGNVVAHLMFAWVNARYTMQPGKEQDNFQRWCLETAAQVVDQFREKAVQEMRENATDRMAKTPGFAEWFVDGILQNAAGTVGLELIRRIVGVAKVKDITCIEKEEDRAAAERICILAAKECIMNRQTGFGRGAAYGQTLARAAEAVQ